MLELQEFSVEHNCRLVLTGDTKQHHSVQWGDALRILERSGVIAQAELTKIYRQRIPQLREAIEDLSKGRTLEGFNKLDKFGVLQEISDDAVRLATIAEKQIEALQAQRSSLIIAPTHGECRAIASAVRQAMKEKGLLSDIEHSVMRLKRLNLGETIRTAIGKRVQGARHKVDAEWRYLLDDYLFKTGASGGRDLEENAREEKTAALQESAESRLSVPIGPAGTGKTTLLSILYTHPQIATGDVLFWRLRARRGCGWSNRHRSPQGLYDRAIPQPASL